MIRPNIIRLIPGRRKRIPLPLMATGLSLLMFSTSCENVVQKGDVPTIKDEAQFMLRLNVQAQSSATRAEGHEFEDGLEAEHYINIPDRDFRIVLYDNATGEFIRELNDLSVTEYDGQYFVESIFTPEKDGPLTEEYLRTSKVDLLVLANWKSYEKNKNNLYPTFANTSLKDSDAEYRYLWKDDSNYNFSTQTGANNYSWIPSMESNNFIPMFGYKEGVSFYKITDGQNTNRVATPVPMLRALAKIEIIDKIQEKGGTSKITGAQISSYNTTGRYIPDVSTNVNWSQNHIQVTSPTLPEDVQKSDNGLVFEEGNYLSNTEEKCFVAYIPEMDFTNNEAKPVIKVTVDNSKEYEIQFTPYLEGKPTEDNGDYNHILRNHIYRYTVNSVSSVNVNLTLEVLPWDVDDEEEWDYSDIPASGKGITVDWNFTGSQVNTEDATVSFDISKLSEVLKGNFTISSPLSGTWHAYLIQEVNDNGGQAVIFCKDAQGTLFTDEDTGKPDHISGLIADGKATIYLRVSEYGTQTESKYKLRVYVENMGMFMEVNMTPDDSDAANWTIIRPTTL